MKGAPMMGNTKSHGTNKNYKMSGMTNADGTAAGAPFLNTMANTTATNTPGMMKNANPTMQTPAVDPNMAQPVQPVMDGAPMYGKKKGAPKLKGGQHKLDHNRDGRITKVDFEGLRSKRKAGKHEDEPDGENGPVLP